MQEPTKFKVGDVVVMYQNVPNDLTACVPGATAVVRGWEWWENGKQWLLDIEWEDTKYRNNQNDGGYYPSMFRLLSERPPFDDIDPLAQDLINEYIAGQ